MAQRTKAFGVRLALGATPRGLASLVLMQAARVALGGLLLFVAMLATLLPAWRAARVDAVEPLRCD